MTNGFSVVTIYVGVEVDTETRQIANQYSNIPQQPAGLLMRRRATHKIKLIKKSESSYRRHAKITAPAARQRPWMDQEASSTGMAEFWAMA